MKLKVNKILTIGLLMCSCQLANTMEVAASNNSNVINTKIANNNISNNIENNINVSGVNNTSNNNINISNNTKNKTKLSEYCIHIPDGNENELTQEEVKKFIDNIQYDLNLLQIARHQAYSLCKNLQNNLNINVHTVLDNYLIDLKQKGFKSIQYYRWSGNDYIAYNIIHEYISHNYNGATVDTAKYMTDKVKQYTHDILKKYMTKIIRSVNLCRDIQQFSKITPVHKGRELNSDLQLRKTQHDSNVIHLKNSHSKCWFISAFQLFIAAVNNSKPNDEIRKTNFAKFVQYLKYKNTMDESTKIKNISEFENTKPQYGESNYKSFNTKWSFRFTHDELKWNVSGSTMDLFTELIIWCSKQDNTKWYNIMSDNQEKTSITQITQEEFNTRQKTLNLLQNMQDIPHGAMQHKLLLIILKLFPELKQIFGGKYDSINNKDLTIEYFANTPLTIKEKMVQEIQLINDCYKEMKLNTIPNTQKRFDIYSKRKEYQNDFNKLNQEYKRLPPNFKLSYINNFVPDLNIISDYNDEMNNLAYGNDEYNHDANYLFITAYDAYKIQNDLEEVVHGYKYITQYNNDGNLEVYELIGISLDGSGHAIACTKNDISLKSYWSGIDSGGFANGDKYTLDELIYYYPDNTTYLRYIKDWNKFAKSLKNPNDKNTYLARVYKYYKYEPQLLLYRKISIKELPYDIQKQIKTPKINRKYNNIHKKKVREKSNQTTMDDKILQKLREI